MMTKDHFPGAFFVTGTDTGIGKTVVSAILTKGLGATYWKPVQSGLHEETDTEAVARMTGLPENHFQEETYRLSEPLSPHASAAIDNVEIDMRAFSIPDYQTQHMVVEGAGGIHVPLNENHMIVDLISQLELPVLIVSRSGLGTLNHTLLTIEALRKRNISILGVVMNGPENESNRKAIEYYGDTSVVAEIETFPELTPLTLKHAFKYYFSS